MIYALQANLSFTTANRRNTVKSAIDNQIATRPRFGNATSVAGTDAGRFTLAVEARFTSEADRDAALAQLESSARAQTAVGRIQRHQCTHDAVTPAPCVVLSEVVL